ncbi:MORN repeat-containing protein 5 [Borealophlyctis nickersoniae]|nr:MORN repeat-containing protein 5 [Borealophlyctis nickersoniae]
MWFCRQGKYTFKDGLEYSLASWDYCTELDRRFYSERVDGFRPGEPQLSNDPAGPPLIPPHTYDVGDGYYDAKDGCVYSYDGVPLREPGEEEKGWIVSHCRVGEEPVESDGSEWT